MHWLFRLEFFPAPSDATSPKPADRASFGALQPNCVSTLVPRTRPPICCLVLVNRRRHSPFRRPKDRCLLRISFHFGGDKPSRDARRGAGFHSWQYCAATTLGHVDRLECVS